MFKVMELLSLYDSYDRVVGNRWVQAHPMVYKTYGMAERILSNLLDAHGGDSWYPEYRVMELDDGGWRVIEPEPLPISIDYDEIPF